MQAQTSAATASPVCAQPAAPEPTLTTAAQGGYTVAEAAPVSAAPQITSVSVQQPPNMTQLVVPEGAVPGSVLNITLSDGRAVGVELLVVSNTGQFQRLIADQYCRGWFRCDVGARWRSPFLKVSGRDRRSESSYQRWSEPSSGFQASLFCCRLCSLSSVHALCVLHVAGILYLRICKRIMCFSSTTAGQSVLLAMCTYFRSATCRGVQCPCNAFLPSSPCCRNHRTFTSTSCLVIVLWLFH